MFEAFMYVVMSLLAIHLTMKIVMDVSGIYQRKELLEEVLELREDMDDINATLNSRLDKHVDKVNNWAENTDKHMVAYINEANNNCNMILGKLREDLDKVMGIELKNIPVTLTHAEQITTEDFGTLLNSRIDEEMKKLVDQGYELVDNGTILADPSTPIESNFSLLVRVKMQGTGFDVKDAIENIWSKINEMDGLDEVDLLATKPVSMEEANNETGMLVHKVLDFSIKQKSELVN